VTIEPSEADRVLREFIAALNQWQRDLYLRWRLDKYEFTGKSLRAGARERSSEELADDWARLASRFVSPSCRLHSSPPEVISSPPVFDGAEARPFVVVAENEPDTAVFELTASLNARFRFVMRKGTIAWLVHDLLSPPDSSDEPWQQGHVV